MNARTVLLTHRSCQVRSSTVSGRAACRLFPGQSPGAFKAANKLADEASSVVHRLIVYDVQVARTVHTSSLGCCSAFALCQPAVRQGAPQLPASDPSASMGWTKLQARPRWACCAPVAGLPLRASGGAGGDSFPHKPRDVVPRRQPTAREVRILLTTFKAVWSCFSGGLARHHANPATLAAAPSSATASAVRRATCDLYTPSASISDMLMQLLASCC